MKTFKVLLTLYLLAVINVLVMDLVFLPSMGTHKSTSFTIAIPQGVDPANAAHQAVVKAATIDNADWWGYQIKSQRGNTFVACRPMRTDECFSATVTAAGGKLTFTSTSTSHVGNETLLANGGIWMLNTPLGVQQ